MMPSLLFAVLVFIVASALTALNEAFFRYFEAGQRFEYPSRRNAGMLLFISVMGGWLFILSDSLNAHALILSVFLPPTVVRIFLVLRGASLPAAIQRVEKAERVSEEKVGEARPLWNLANARLDLYFERNLSQIRSIFWLTVLVLIVGFTLMGYGVFQAFQANSSIEASVLATASGILTQFLAATFLVLYRSTINQASAFVSALERMNAFGIAIQIIDTIPEEYTSMQQEARSQLAAKIVESIAQVKSDASSGKKGSATPGV